MIAPFFPSWISSGSNETSIADWDDIDDFHTYRLDPVPEYPTFGCTVAVNYVDALDGFHTTKSSPTAYKNIMVKITHSSLSALTDTMIISSGF